MKDRKFKLGDLIEEKILKKSSSDNELITFVGMEDVSEDGKLINQNVMKFSELKNGLTYFERKDVLVAKITPCFENSKGACLDNLKTEKGYGSTEFHVLRSNSKSIPRYIYYITQLKRFRKQLEGQMIGTAGHRRVPMEAIKNFTLEILHPLPEQKAIAKVLSDMDELIESMEKLIHKKKQIKQGAMQELLTGKKRLAGFSGEWEVKRLGEILKVRHGKSQWQVVVEDGKYPILATGGEIGRTNYYLYDKPSVLIGRKGTIDKPQYIDTPFWTIDTLFYTEISNNYCSKYIYYVFNRIDWYSYNEASGVPSLNASTIESISIPLPPLPEQKAIAQILSDMDDEIEALEKKLDKYKKIKEGMMEKLLTGQVRLV